MISGSSANPSSAYNDETTESDHNIRHEIASPMREGEEDNYGVTKPVVQHNAKQYDDENNVKQDPVVGAFYSFFNYYLFVFLL
jgi:hypothetical protein